MQAVSRHWLFMLWRPMANVLRLTVKVVPRAGVRKYTLEPSGALKCYLKSPPENGAANAELIKTLAKNLGLTQQDITIIRGATTRTKILSIRTTMTIRELLAKLQLEVQYALF